MEIRSATTTLDVSCDSVLALVAVDSAERALVGCLVDSSLDCRMPENTPRHDGLQIVHMRISLLAKVPAKRGQALLVTEKARATWAPYRGICLDPILRADRVRVSERIPPTTITGRSGGGTAERSVDRRDPLGDPAGIPFALLSRLREQAPVAVMTDGRFFVTRYDDVLDALRRIDEFVGSMRDPGVSVPPDEMLLIEMAEPRHGRIRRFFNAGVSKARVAQLEPWIRSLCEDALDRILAADGPIDLAAAYVRTMPTSVIARLVGASADDHAQIATWVDELSRSEYLSRNQGPLGPGLEHGFPDFYAYLHKMVAARREMGKPTTSSRS